MSKARLIFLRGLNSHPEEGVYLGPLNLGPAAKNLQQEMAKRSVPFYNISNMGSGSIEVQAQEAKKQILNLQDEKLFLLGHSQGGLIARALSHDPILSQKISAVLTVATPHQGSQLADAAIHLRKNHYALYQALKVFKYDTQKKTDLFQNVSTKGAQDFNQKYPIKDHMASYSISCSMKTYQLPSVLLPLPLIMKSNELTDGFVQENSQHWGQHLGHLPLDHIAQLGYFIQINPLSRLKAQRLFTDMIDLIVNCYEKSN